MNYGYLLEGFLMSPIGYDQDMYPLEIFPRNTVSVSFHLDYIICTYFWQ